MAAVTKVVFGSDSGLSPGSGMERPAHQKCSLKQGSSGETPKELKYAQIESSFQSNAAKAVGLF
jgi:hypothetical protein